MSASYRSHVFLRRHYPYQVPKVGIDPAFPLSLPRQAPSFYEFLQIQYNMLPKFCKSYFLVPMALGLQPSGIGQ